MGLQHGSGCFGVRAQQFWRGQRRVADAAGRAMAFMLVAIAAGCICAASGGCIGRSFMVRAHVVMQVLRHGHHLAQRLGMTLALFMAHGVGGRSVLLHGHGVACQTTQGQQQNHEQGEKTTHDLNDNDGRDLVPRPG